jgi:ATP-dependent DNA ligase
MNSSKLITTQDVKFLRYPIATEIKYDGEYTQIIINNNDIYMVNKYNTIRRDNPILREFMQQLNENRDVKFLNERFPTDMIKHVFVGELCCRKPNTPFNQFLSYVRNGEWSKLELRVFDILEIYHQQLPAVQYEEKRKMIETIFYNGEYVKLSEQKVCKTPEEALRFFERAVNKGYEGIMLKPLNSINEKGWFKLKPFYDIDVVVVGVSKQKQSFIIGLYNGNELKTVGKVSIPDEHLYYIVKKLAKKHLIKEDNDHLYLPPKIVIQVNFHSLIPSKKYSLGYALRFPRYMRLRKDKKAHECTVKQIPSNLFTKS